MWKLDAGSATKLADVGSDAHELAVGSDVVSGRMTTWS